MKLSESLRFLTCLFGFWTVSGMTQSIALAREDLVPGSRYTSARGAGMGDAMLPLADDGASALFYNPAGIAGLKGFHFEPISFGASANEDFVRMFNKNAMNVNDLKAYKPQLQARPNLYQETGYYLLPNISFRGFAAGVLYQSRRAAHATGGNIEYRSEYQLIPAAGFGLPMAHGIVRMGYVFQWVQRAAGTVSLPSNTTGLAYNKFLPEGTAMSHNFGLSINLPVSYLPSINAVVRNIGGAKYRDTRLIALAAQHVGVPKTEQMSFDAALGLSPKLGRGTNFNMVFEGRDLSNRSGMSLMGRLAFGGEIDFRRLLYARIGYSSGYPSVGVGIRHAKTEFNVSWSSEEVGTGYHNTRDTRYLLEYQIRPF